MDNFRSQVSQICVCGSGNLPSTLAIIAYATDEKINMTSQKVLQINNMWCQNLLQLGLPSCRSQLSELQAAVVSQTSHCVWSVNLDMS